MIAIAMAALLASAPDVGGFQQFKWSESYADAKAAMQAVHDGGGHFAPVDNPNALEMVGVQLGEIGFAEELDFVADKLVRVRLTDRVDSSQVAVVDYDRLALALMDKYGKGKSHDEWSGHRGSKDDRAQALELGRYGADEVEHKR
jgi:hypothetical protein